MSELEFYKPHIRIKFFADVENTNESKLVPPITVNRYPDDLEVNCTVVRDCLQSNFALTLLLDIINLNTYVKWQLLDKKYRYILVYAGYLESDYYEAENKDEYIDSKLKIIFKGYIVWMGNIVEARKKVTTRFLAVQNPSESLTAYTENMSLRFSAGYNMYQLINDVLKLKNNPNVKLNISEEDYQQLIEVDYEVSTFNPKSLDSILSTYGITIQQGFDLTEGYISEATYIEMNSEAVPPDDETNVVEVSENSGLINIPTLQTSGTYPTVRFTMLYDNRLKTFMYCKLANADIQLPSDISSAEDVPDVANSGLYLDQTEVVDENGVTTYTGYGYYLVLKITYSLESRGGNFTQEIEASPYNMYNKILNGETTSETEE